MSADLCPAGKLLAVACALAALAHPAAATRLAGWLGAETHRALGLDRLAQLGLDHLALAASGLGIVGVLGVALGILATRPAAAPARATIDGLAAAAQAVPPVVAVALALPILGFGGPPTLLALAAYGIMPVLRGTAGALGTVPEAAREAARALGLTPRQTLLHVELPLAAPGILAALRTALVLAVGTAAVGALAGASTLGTPVVAGLQNGNTVPMLQGTAATAALAFFCDAAMLAVAAIVIRR